MKVDSHDARSLPMQGVKNHISYGPPPSDHAIYFYLQIGIANVKDIAYACDPLKLLHLPDL